VALWNLDTIDPTLGHRVRATVEVDSGDERLLGVEPVAFLVPLTAVAVIRHAPTESVGPLVSLLGNAAELILQGENEARSIRIREGLGEALSEVDSALLEAEAGSESFAAWTLATGAPELVARDNSGRAFKTVKARLKERKEAYFATVSGARNGYQAGFGLIGLVEHVARTESYKDVVEPAASGLALLADIYFNELGAPPSFLRRDDPQRAHPR
jgi:hypothetical protein